MKLLTVFLAALTLLSPDGRISVSVDTSDGIRYSVSYGGSALLEASEISMTLLDGSAFGKGSRLRSAKTSSHDGIIPTPIFTAGAIRDNYNALALDYGRFSVEFRAYDQGVAYRFVSKLRKGVIVKDEQAEFNFAGDYDAFVPYAVADRVDGMNGEKQFMNTFENLYTRHKLSEWLRPKGGNGAGGGRGTPSGTDSLAFLPISVKTPGCLVSITEADLYHYPGMYLTGNGGSGISGEAIARQKGDAAPDAGARLKAVFAPYPASYGQGGYHNNVKYVVDANDYIAEAGPRASFPWRVIAIAGRDCEMMENTMVRLLSRPDDGRDWSWVQPGKAVWEWMVNWNLRGVPFRSGVNTATYKYFIDFASAHGTKYLLMDEGWFEIGPADMMKVVPELDLRELCRYASERGVKLILWAGAWDMDRRMDEICAHYSEMGVSGFKVDFLNRDDQTMVEFSERVAATAAKYRMVIIFHGIFKPSGLDRQYPNVLNFEGDYALENMKWPNPVRQPEYDVTTPFARCICGPMDMNPGLMQNTIAWRWAPDRNDPHTQGTRCHQLAAYIMYPAPLSMLSDAPTTYEREMECFNFINAIPTVWDQSVAVDGRIAEYAVIARRSGEDWYLGAMTNWDDRKADIRTDFLEPGCRYLVTQFVDGPNSYIEARDYLKQEYEITGGDVLPVYMCGGGGFAAKFRKL